MFRKRRWAVAVKDTVRPVIEGLESRQLLSASLNSHGVLNVHGTPHADTITVAPSTTNPAMLDVTVNGKMKAFSASGVSHIKVNSGAGNDSVTVDSGVTAPSTIVGGMGNDTLVAGGGSDLLKAGAGNCVLQGGSGNDTLLGGAGHDTIVSGTGQDSINGGKGKDTVEFSPNAGVPVTAVPQSVQTGLSTLAAGAPVTSVQPFVDDKQTYYGTNVSLNGQSTRIVVNADGVPVGDAPPTHGAPGGQNPGGTTTGGPEQNDGIFGLVISTDATANTITISAGNPWGPATNTTFKLTSTTTITADSATVMLGSLAAGTLVSIQTGSTDATTATSITAIDKRVGGTVSAIDTTANTIAITDRSGTATTYNLNASVTVTLAGVASTLAAVTTNSHVQLQLSAIDGTVVGIESDPQENPVVPPVMPTGVGGKIVSVDATANTITLANEDAIQTTYTVSPTAVVTLDGAASTLSALVAGDFTQLQLSTDGTTVTTITALSPQANPGGGGSGGGGSDDHMGVVGPISAVDATAGTITLTTPGGTPTTYSVSSTATITLDDAVSTLSGLAAGDFAFLQLSSDGTTVTAIHASSAPQPMPPEDPNIVGGSVLSVDATANTITIQNDSAPSTTYTLGAMATVTLDGAASTLSAILAGDEVHLQLSSDGKTVTNVEANSQINPGQGQPVTGLVLSVDTTANTITIQNESSPSTTYTLGAMATVSLDGATSTLSAIVAGDAVALAISSDGKSVTNVEAYTQMPPGGPGENEPVEGLVLSVDTTANTITIQNESSPSTTYTLGAMATVTLDGAASTLSAIVAGDATKLTLSSDGTSVTSVEAYTQMPPGGPGENEPVTGLVLSVDTTANTITIQNESSPSTTYTLGAMPTITLDGGASTLSAIVAGDAVKLTLSSDGKSVTGVEAYSQPPVQPPPLGGSVLSVNGDAHTITIQNQMSPSTTYTLGAMATVTLDGAVSTLSAIMPGDQVQLQLSSDQMTVTSVTAHTMAPPPPPPM